MRPRPLTTLLTTLALATALPHATAQSTLTLESGRQWADLPPDIFGYNINIPATAGLHVKKTPWDHPVMAEKIQALSPGNLRFPGGTLSQFYNWRTQRQDPPHPFGKNPPDFVYEIDGNQSGFLALCQEQHITPFFVFNALMDDPQNQWEWALSLEDADGRPRVTHWEIGNEVPEVVMFHEKDYHGPIRSAEDYAATARTLGSRILGRWPDARVAIVSAAAIQIQQTHVPDTERDEQQHWNTVLGSDRSYYNAIVQHIYLHAWPQFQDRLNWTTPELANWLFSAGDSYPRWINDYLGRYYDNTPIWLTEVGMVNWEGNAEARQAAEKQWWSRLAEVNFILSLLAERGNIEVVSKHLLAAPRDKMPIQVIADGDELGDARLISPIADMLIPIGEATHGGNSGTAAKIDELAVRGTPSFQGKLRAEGRRFPTVRAITITHRGTEYLFVLNRGPEPMKLQLPGRGWTGQAFHAELETHDDHVAIDELNALGSQPLNLPAYSYTWLKRSNTAEADAR